MKSPVVSVVIIIQLGRIKQAKVLVPPSGVDYVRSKFADLLL